MVQVLLIDLTKGWLGFGGWLGVVGWVGGPQYFRVIPWYFENGALIKIDDVLAEDGALLHVLPLEVHLNFFDGQVGWTNLDHSYFLNFFAGPLLHA